jgi:glycerate kinase
VPCVAVAGVVRLSPAEVAAAGLAGAHALTDVEPDLQRCLAEPAAVLTELAERLLPQHLS